MDRIDGRPVYSATDLVAYLACEHLTQLERAAHRRASSSGPIRDDPELDVIRKRGFEHEARFLADLRADGRDRRRRSSSTARRRTAARSCAPPRPGRSRRWPPAPTSSTRRRSSTARSAATPTSCSGSRRPDRPSRWGPYHYEVADTKLARHVKASAVLQICSYVDQLERIQGVRPEWLHVALGGSARTVERLRVDDYMAYYRSARDRFLRGDGRRDAPPTYPPAGTYPDPVEHCDVCRWAAECATRRRADDHLSLVAGISGRQRRALTRARRRRRSRRSASCRCR